MTTAVAEAPSILTPRWTRMRYHREQRRLWDSRARWDVVVAGRRSGKTEIAGKRRVVRRAMEFTEYPDGLFVIGAPTHQQVKRVYWDDLKALVPPWAMRGKPSESELTIYLVHGPRIMLAGFDKPSRIEGQPIDGIVLDEYDDMKPEVFQAHVRPALSTPGRLGWGTFLGVPEGFGNLHQRMKDALADLVANGGVSDYFHWKSEEILDAEEIEAAKDELDEATYRQEYEASFETFTGRAYYSFRREIHAGLALKYNPAHDLCFCFDFNVSPGVAAVVQEQDVSFKGVPERVTGIVGEVWIGRNSTTPMVCRKLLQDWGRHQGRVLCYGDATGGASGSAKVQGSDWDLIREALAPVYGSRLEFRVPKANPKERVRVNAMNSRILSATGKIRLFVDPKRAPHVADDLEGVVLNELGEIDKKTSSERTHISDALGYYVVKEFPVRPGGRIEVTPL